MTGDNANNLGRRDFLRKAAAWTAAVGAAASSRSLWAAEQRWDLVVVGAGTAGLPAAIFASRRGARVLLIDTAADIGGTLHLANGQVSAAGTSLQKATRHQGLAANALRRHHAGDRSHR